MNKRLLPLAAAVLALTALQDVPTASQAQAPAAAAPRSAASTCGGTNPTYSGAPIDVDFQGSDLRTTLRLLADTGGINLVLDPSLPETGKVDVKLTQVPWDQVLDVVLRASQLTCVPEGSVLRVLTRAARTRELDEEARQRRATEQLPDLERLQTRLSYASAAAMRELIKAGRIISERGTVDIDERTNTLIVKDVPRNLQDVRELIAGLDLPEPQVEIEAQIIETDHDSARALGIQWGLNGRATQELGNTTGLGFPNSVTVGGRTNSTQGASGSDPRATPLERAATAVDLGANAPNSALGLTLGAINGAFNIDVAISALQRKGQLKILSKPKVTTQNNKQAEVATGFQVPFQTVSNNTVVIQFRDAALKLSVLPQITASGTVIMRIALTNDFPDFSRSVNGNPSINTQRATTEVQVGDGMTTVIGGINQVKEQVQNDQTPGLGNVPLLGWLFKRNQSNSESQELFIFITPRIIRG
jgi:type IV pilus assembly protein PilQ